VKKGASPPPRKRERRILVSIYKREETAANLVEFSNSLAGVRSVNGNKRKQRKTCLKLDEELNKGGTRQGTALVVGGGRRTTS